MPPVGFEPTISTGERPQTYALERAAAATGFNPSASPSIRRILGRRRRSTFKFLPSQWTEEFLICCDEIATIYLKKKTLLAN